MPQPKFGPYSDYLDPYVKAQQLTSNFSQSSSSPSPSLSSSPNKSGFVALLSVLGNIISSVFSYQNQQSVNATNRWLAGHQNELNIAQWQRENSYNSPLAQIERLRSAGLNPGLLMSNGIENIAAQSPQMVSSQGAASARFSNPFSTFATDLKTSQLMDAQRENIEADTAQKLASAGLTDVQRNIAGVNLKILLKNGEKISDATLKSLETGIEKLQSEIGNINQDTAIKILEERKIRFYVDNMQPQELNKLVAETGLSLAQTKEILELLPTKILLNKAMADSANASARLANANAAFQEKLNKSDEYVQAIIDSAIFDSEGKLTDIMIKMGQNSAALKYGYKLYNKEDFNDFEQSGGEFLSIFSQILGSLGNLFTGVIRN